MLMGKNQLNNAAGQRGIQRGGTESEQAAESSVLSVDSVACHASKQRMLRLQASSLCSYPQRRTLRGLEMGRSRTLVWGS